MCARPRSGCQHPPVPAAHCPPPTAHYHAGTAQFATPGFVHTHKVGVCRGAYSPALVRAWRAWDTRHVSENDPVDILPRDQLYMVIAMEDCGRDLEGAAVQGFRQARSVLLQVGAWGLGSSWPGSVQLGGALSCSVQLGGALSCSWAHAAGGLHARGTG
jgi:hypothetical protein